jgi:hypothetical protein
MGQRREKYSMYRAGVVRERLGLGESGVEGNKCGWIRVRRKWTWNGDKVGRDGVHTVHRY